MEFSTNSSQPESSKSWTFGGYFQEIFEPCMLPDERLWQGYLAYSLLSFIVLLICLGIWRLIKIFWRRRQWQYYHTVSGGEGANLDDENTVEPPWSSDLKRVCAELVSGQRTSGKIVMSLEFVAGITAFCIYLSLISRSPDESASSWFDHHDWQIDFACHFFLLIIFILRLIAANHKLWYLVSIFSLVDFLTIPTSILTFICVSRSWIGLRFLRAFHILTVPDLLQLCIELKSRTFTRLAQLVCVLLSVLLAASGMFHLVEEPTEPGRSFWAYVYFSIITLSTIGYGDISPATSVGRLFCCFFILSALALFASSIPELTAIVASRKKYAGPFKAEPGTGHVVVCGTITPSTMTSILQDFNRKDRKRDDVKLVFVSDQVPDLEMEAIIKRYWTKLQYIQGSLLNLEGLRQAQVHHALAVLFVADQGSRNPDQDDSSTVMCVASVKNFTSRTRCIVQLLQSNAKSLLLNIPSFSMKKSGDCVVCFHELELALMAKSCLAPGAATLISNMIRTPSRQIKNSDPNPIIQDYFRGCHMEIYLESFSSHLYDMTFFEAVVFCFSKLNILLVGLFKPQTDNRQQGLRLAPSDIKITQDQIGIFVIDSKSALERVKCYCDYCHRDVQNLAQITKCNCKTSEASNTWHRKSISRNPFEHLLRISDPNSQLRKASNNALKRPIPGWEKKLHEEIKQIAALKREFSKHEVIQNDYLGATLSGQETNRRVDTSGNFYWAQAKPFRSVLMDQDDAVSKKFSNHIVALIMAKAKDPKIGLLSFVLPLRSSRIPYDELKEIVLLGNARFLDNEWADIADLPKITIVEGDPLNRADLRSVSIKTCSMCVILSAWTGSTQSPSLDDRDAVLAALNVKAMPFEDIDEDGNYSGYFGVPILAEIQHDENARLLTSNSEDVIDPEDFCLSDSFMCGEALSFAALNSLFVASYVNPLIVPIIYNLLYGLQSPQMDNFLAEGVGLVGGSEYSPNSISPYNTRIDLVGIYDGPWSLPSKPEVLQYVQLVEAAAAVRKVCLGLSRILRDEKSDYIRHPKRCVITNPDRFYIVQPDDLVFVLTQ